MMKLLIHGLAVKLTDKAVKELVVNVKECAYQHNEDDVDDYFAVIASELGVCSGYGELFTRRQHRFLEILAQEVVNCFPVYVGTESDDRVEELYESIYHCIADGLENIAFE